MTDSGALEHFLDSWYGPATRPAEPRPGRLPALAAWHAEAARRGVPLARQNDVLDEDRAWLDGARLVVYVENQAVWLWAVDPGGSDPPVFERANEPGQEWTPTGESLSDFLVHVAQLEAVLGAPGALWFVDLSAADVRRLTDRMTRLPTRPWRWPGPDHALWERGRALALTCRNTAPDQPPDPDDLHLVVVAAPTARDTEFALEVGLAPDT